MKRRILIGYQLLTGMSDASTGLLLLIAPVFTLRLMGVHVAGESLTFLSYIGAFVLAVGLACLYGAMLVLGALFREKLEVVWLLTAITRGLVAAFILVSLARGTLEMGWATVAATDGAIALVQAIGLWRGWLALAEE